MFLRLSFSRSRELRRVSKVSELPRQWNVLASTREIPRANPNVARRKRREIGKTQNRSSRPIGSRVETATGGRILQAGRHRRERVTRERVAHGSLEIRMLACATRRRHRADPQGPRDRARRRFVPERRHHSFSTEIRCWFSLSRPALGMRVSVLQ